MRRYKIIAGEDTWDSAPGGRPDPNALQVDLDISVTTADAPNNGSHVRIWGLGLRAISQTKKYYGKNIEVHGGMARGLPLAKPQQFGLLAKGIITQAYGNWEGVNQTLDLVFAPGGEIPCGAGPNPMPPKKNIVLDWKKDKKLEEALRSTLRTAFPGMQIEFDLSEQLKADQDRPSYHPNLAQLNYELRRITQELVGGHYPGVSIELSQGKIKVWDKNQNATRIEFSDLIGMPTWIGPQTIQVKVVMRGDLDISKKITLPQTFVNSSQSGAPVGSAIDQQMSFAGDWDIQELRHIGASRAPAGDAWITVITAYSNQLSGASTENCPSKEGGD